MPFFNAAVDAYVRACPSTSGDLNVYGDAFGEFLAGYPPAADLPYLPDVARLEWAVDEAGRAADRDGSPEGVLAALAGVPPEPRRAAPRRRTMVPTRRIEVPDPAYLAHEPGGP